jgi:hypothetical protein
LRSFVEHPVELGPLRCVVDGVGVPVIGLDPRLLNLEPWLSVVPRLDIERTKITKARHRRHRRGVECHWYADREQRHLDECLRRNCYAAARLKAQRDGRVGFPA